MNFKDTLNILKTDFEMQGHLPQKEPAIQQQWLEKKVYQRILKERNAREQKNLHDGPPYANGMIHMGHASNKILKDIIVRRYNLLGYYSNYIAGWDTHGMPIEHALEQSLIKQGKESYKSMGVVQKRDACKQYALDQIEVQKKQFARLGLESDMSTIYRTMDPEFEYHQLEIFYTAVEKGLVYRDLKPIYWSWSSQTALAEAEVEYADVKSDSIYLTFEVTEGNDKLSTGDKLMVWTTTPWTLPSNQAIAVHPNLYYKRVKANGKYYVVSSSRLSAMIDLMKWTACEVVSEFLGKEVENVKYKSEIYNLTGPVILAEYVLDSNGTGLVHNASGFGMEDYLACKKYGIKPFAPINGAGYFDAQVKTIDPALEGKFYLDANPLVVEKLQAAGALLSHEVMTHSAAIDWRTKKPLMFRATYQWFINLENIKAGMLESISNVVFPNETNKQQLSDMIMNRVEWCISRQRYWGVPIPLIFDENEQPIFDNELNAHILEIFKKETTNVWFDHPAEYFLTKKYLDTGKKFSKQNDTLDVWFDSGTSYTVLEANGLEFPAELYFEGKDQFRGWFNSSLINSYIYKNQAPYRQLLGHGFVVDELGRKMSKSLGNGVNPIDVCETLGADILRLWAATNDYTTDMKIGKEILSHVTEMYRKLRNTLFKFVLSNVSDFDFSKDKVYDNDEVNNLVLSQLEENLATINKAYENFDFISVMETVLGHVIELSTGYFDTIKDTLYCDEANNPNRRAVQTVLYHVLTSYLFALAPVLPHTCEEVYSFLKVNDKLDSVFLVDMQSESYATNYKFTHQEVNKQKWVYFKKLKDLVYAKLEQLRNKKEITKNTQAKVVLTFDNKFGFTEKELVKNLNVAFVEFVSTNIEEVEVEVSNSGFVRCERCWNYFPADELNEEHVCARCQTVLNSLKK